MTPRQVMFEFSRCTIICLPRSISNKTPLTVRNLHMTHSYFHQEDLIISFLSTHGGVTMGTEACSFVAGDNSCLYLWQANRLIKGSHVCFLCPIPSPKQTLPYLYCAALAVSTFPSLLCCWHADPAIRFVSPPSPPPFLPVGCGRAGSERMQT